MSELKLLVANFKPSKRPVDLVTLPQNSSGTIGNKEASNINDKGNKIAFVTMRKKGTFII
ncbi:MAG: hypothetical protein HC903_10525 [Methylacidiphilales bacterium]|nr:hypothetical protein [Candidatus Methylacidiphilales bacterium]NJR17320.1 hypothetical protein [Calothrix sp. CSU_2_0]